MVNFLTMRLARKVANKEAFVMVVLAIWRGKEKATFGLLGNERPDLQPNSWFLHKSTTPAAVFVNIPLFPNILPKWHSVEK
jgi:hypothetical protein